MTKKITAKKLRLQAYNKIIARNKKLFQQGKSISCETFANLFGLEDIVTVGTYKELHRSNLRLVTLQNELNLLMRENGLYIHSTNYYTTFTVSERNVAKSTAIRYSSTVDVAKSCTQRLSDNYIQRVKDDTWGTYNKLSVAQIDDLLEPVTSTRHERVKSRIKHW